MDPNVITSLIAVGGVSFIAALTQTVKPFVSDGRWYPPIAILLGLIINFLAAWALGTLTRAGLVAAGFSGITAGLAASGLYSLTQVGKQDVPSPPPVPKSV